MTSGEDKNMDINMVNMDMVDMDMVDMNILDNVHWTWI